MLDELLKLKEDIDAKFQKNSDECGKIGTECYTILEKLNIIREKGGDLARENELRTQLEQLKERDYALWVESVQLRKEYEEVKEKMYFLTPPAGSNDVVDLRTADGMRYDIFLHGERTAVGSVEYRGYHVSDYLGDVGGYVHEKYRGHHYLYEALCVLGEILGEKDISDFWITTYKDNYASKKSVERYGGTLIDDGSRHPGVLLYECLTRKKEFGTKK